MDNELSLLLHNAGVLTEASIPTPGGQPAAERMAPIYLVLTGKGESMQNKKLPAGLFMYWTDEAAARQAFEHMTSLGTYDPNARLIRLDGRITAINMAAQSAQQPSRKTPMGNG
jgi:hypothetical protein